MCNRIQAQTGLIVLLFGLWGCDNSPGPEVHVPPKETETVREFSFAERFPDTYGLYGELDLADYDSDGDIDVLVVGLSNQGFFGSLKAVRVFRNEGGRLQEVDTDMRGVSADGAWGDYDKDGDADVVITGTTALLDDIIKLYRNDGGIFTDSGQKFDPIEGEGLDWGDFDNDGDLDLIVTGFEETNNNPCSRYRGVWVTRIYRNDLVAGFREIDIQLPGAGDYLEWADHDQDNDLDILMGGNTIHNCEFTYTARVFRYEEGQYIDTNAGLTPVSSGEATSWGDYDGDGDLDIFLSGYRLDTGRWTTELYYNSGGQFSRRDLNLGSLEEPGASAWGDYDEDGDLDLALSGRNNLGAKTTRIYRNDNGSFVDIGAKLEDVSGGDLAWGDYDSDGDLDLFITGLNENNIGFVWVYRQDTWIE